MDSEEATEASAPVEELPSAEEPKTEETPVIPVEETPAISVEETPPVEEPTPAPVEEAPPAEDAAPIQEAAEEEVSIHLELDDQGDTKVTAEAEETAEMPETKEQVEEEGEEEEEEVPLQEEATEMAASLKIIGQGVSELPSEFVMKPQHDVIDAAEEKDVTGLEETVSDADEEELRAITVAVSRALSQHKLEQEREEAKKVKKKKKTATEAMIDAVKEKMEKAEKVKEPRSSLDMVREEKSVVAFGSAYTFEIASHQIEEEIPEAEEEEEEGEGKVEEEEKVILDREPYYNLYDSILERYNGVKLKNNFLHKKITEYFLNRKMEHFFREEDHQQLMDNVQTYHQKLEYLGHLKELETTQKTSINTEIREQRELKETQLEIVVEDFKKMQDRQKEIATGMKFVKSGRELTEREITKALTRQSRAVALITDHRKRYVLIRDRVAEKQAALRALETIGEGLYLLDYEQMKAENQRFADKIEERDEELNKLRVKCTNVSQVIAHHREKSASATLEYIELQAVHREMEMEQNEARERLSSFKQDRKFYRNATLMLKEKFGLLTNDTLLRDMETSLQLREKLRQELANVKETYARTKKDLTCIRKNLEFLPHKVITLKKPPKEKEELKYYNRRPTLTVPILPKKVYGYRPVYNEDT